MRGGHVQLRRQALLLCRVCWLACALALLADRVEAQAPLQVGAQLTSTKLGKHVAVLEDASGKLALADVMRPELERLFEPARDDAPTYGLNKSALWLRMQVVSGSPRAEPWLLELAYPHLDFIELYAPDGRGGYVVHATGDNRPFRERDLAYHNFVFKLEEPAAAHGPVLRTYYLRVQTGGSLSLPLVAWSYEAFIAHQNRELPLLWMFYGVILVMAIYNLFIYFAVRRVEYLYYVLYNFTLAVLEFTLAGHAFEYLCPDDVWLANHLLPCLMSLMFLWTSLFFRRYLSLEQTLPSFDRYYGITAWISLGIAFYSMLVPPGESLRVVIMVALAHTVVSMAAALVLVGRNYRPAKLYSIAWLALLCGIFGHLLKSMGILSISFYTEWGIQAGAALEVILLSFALADRITIMRENLSELNAQLSHNVNELLGALARAEDATRAKSEFLATMSHELRTPLNAIINIPQGLLSDFLRADSVLCSACDSVFEPEPGDLPLAEGLGCPHCAVKSALRVERITRYIGNPEQTVHHLAMVERSGKHLLQMVDGVLDFSKLDASALKLRLEQIEVGNLVAEAVDTVAELANRAQIPILLELEPALGLQQLVADPLRVKQVLINLIGNALKFSEHRGEVSITVGAHRTLRSFVFFVRDEGIGIAAEDQARIFERFEQVDRGDTRRYGGTGLGLSISRSLVEMHAGRIWVESSHDVGSTFFFELPVSGPAYSSNVLPALDAEPISEVLARVPTLARAHAEAHATMHARLLTRAKSKELSS